MQTWGYYVVQGHSRSPSLVPIESSYATSYCSILAPFPTYSLDRSKIAIFGYRLAFRYPHPL